MRVALGQLDMVWEDKEASFLKAEHMMEQAKDAGCDVIVFPEMSFTGYSMNVKEIAEEREHSMTKERMKRDAVKYGIGIGYGYAAFGQSQGKGRNCFVMIDESGRELGEYSKLHPFTYGGESDCFEKGQEILTFAFHGRRIALFICYDLRFPEIFHIAAKEADIMFVIANWPAIRREHWQTLLRARAIETQSYVVGVNCVGERDHTVYSGDSMAVDCIGNILGVLSGREDILVCDLEDRAGHLREKFSTAADRREEFYSDYFRR